jgi:hypothetical protein
MTKDFIPYEQALVLKELGFNEPCLIKDTEQGEECAVYYVHQNGVPTFSQVFRFFRDNFNLEPQVKSWKEKGGIIWHYSIQKIGEPSIFRSSDCAVDSHDEAQLICLQKLIQIVKNEKLTRSNNG